MSNIVLTHPVHGAKVAISEQEARQDELRGWKRFVQPVTVVTEPVTIITEPVIPAFLTQISEPPKPVVENIEKAVESSLNTLAPRRGKRKQEG